uniref:Uncharacterized protein n=1 Tax=Sinocyclocheilus grahami TaxID=75366 RepID=A0A672PQ28_SINGR
MCSIKIRLFLNTLPFALRYKLWYLKEKQNYTFICVSTLSDGMFTKLLVTKKGSCQINVLTTSVIKFCYTVTEYHCTKLDENTSSHVPKSSQNTHTSHPAQLLWHTSISRTLSLTCKQTQPEKSSSMNGILAASSTRVNGYRLLDDQPILHQLANLLIGIGNLIGFIWIQPHFLLATAQNAGRQPLLKPEHAGDKKKKKGQF